MKKKRETGKYKNRTQNCFFNQILSLTIFTGDKQINGREEHRMIKRNETEDLIT